MSQGLFRMQRAYRTSRDEKRTLELAHGRVSKAVISDFAMATGRLKTHQMYQKDN